jgi:hypothetical protein
MSNMEDRHNVHGSELGLRNILNFVNGGSGSQTFRNVQKMFLLGCIYMRLCNLFYLEITEFRPVINIAEMYVLTGCKILFFKILFVSAKVDFFEFIFSQVVSQLALSGNSEFPIARLQIRVRIRVKSWMRNCIKVKIQERWRLKMDPWRAMDTHNSRIGGVEAQNVFLEGL